MATRQTPAPPATINPATASALPVATMAQELDALRPEIEKVLPPHIGADKFMRVCATALVLSPELRNADRRSFCTAAIKAATDGLVPDGREGAFVIFNTKEKDGEGRERFVKKVQWMPMIGGVMKKIRNSGELKSFSSNAVYSKDTFRYWIDDEGEHILHEPALGDERGAFSCVYAVAKTLNGGVYTEVMTKKQVDAVRAVSKAANSGPWVSWYDEMARKTVSRRLSKRMPMSSDIEQVLQRDDDLYDLEKPREAIPVKSGAGAARRALGLAEPTNGAPPATETGNGGSAAYTVESAVKALGECKTVAEWEICRDAILIDFDQRDEELPLEIDAALNARKEWLEEHAPN